MILYNKIFTHVIQDRPVSLRRDSTPRWGYGRSSWQRSVETGNNNWFIAIRETRKMHDLMFQMLTSTTAFKKLLNPSKLLTKALPIPMNLSPVLPYLSCSLSPSTIGVGCKKDSKTPAAGLGSGLSKKLWAFSFSNRTVSRASGRVFITGAWLVNSMLLCWSFEGFSTLLWDSLVRAWLIDKSCVREKISERC